MLRSINEFDMVRHEHRDIPSTWFLINELRINPVNDSQLETGRVSVIIAYTYCASQLTS
jgi:hypothetical protein